jgi:hypothetical protein
MHVLIDVQIDHMHKICNAFDSLLSMSNEKLKGKCALGPFLLCFGD